MAKQIHDTNYLFLTTRVRALECQLLERGQMEQMLEAATPQEAARILTDCGYPELDPVNGETLGNMLAREREKTFQDLGELVPDPAVLAVFQVQHDYHNLKVEAMGLNGDRLLVDTGRVPGEDIAAAVRSGELGDLPGLLAEAIGEARQVLAAHPGPPAGGLYPGPVRLPGAGQPGPADRFPLSSRLCPADHRRGQPPHRSAGAADG